MINNLIQGYALGCLSPEEIKQVRQGSDDHGELNYKDLGKYQNLAALLPLSLPAEIPDQKVKEKIARKLYRIKNETGPKLDALTGNIAPNAPEKKLSKERTVPTISVSSTAERYKRITGQSISLNDKKISRDIKEIDLNTMGRYKYIAKNKLFLYLAGAVAAGLLLGFFIFYENNDAYLAEISKLSIEAQDLNNELITNTGVLTLLEKKDTKVYQLSGSEVFPDGYGKVYINPSSKRAYLYIHGIEPLKHGNYQLWIIKAGSFYPVALFNPNTSPAYLYFNFPDLTADINLTVLLTEEPVGGSPKPGRKVHLRTQD